MGEALDIGAVNGPHHTTVAGLARGDGGRSSESSTRSASPTRRSLCPHGYHSRMMEPIVEPYRRVTASVGLRSARPRQTSSQPSWEGPGNGTRLN